MENYAFSKSTQKAGKTLRDGKRKHLWPKHKRPGFAYAFTKAVIAYVVASLSIFLPNQEKEVVGSTDSLLQRRIGCQHQTFYHCNDIPPCSSNDTFGKNLYEECQISNLPMPIEDDEQWATGKPSRHANPTQSFHVRESWQFARSCNYDVSKKFMVSAFIVHALVSRNRTSNTLQLQENDFQFEEERNLVTAKMSGCCCSDDKWCNKNKMKSFLYEGTSEHYRTVTAPCLVLGFPVMTMWKPADKDPSKSEKSACPVVD